MSYFQPSGKRCSAESSRTLVAGLTSSEHCWSDAGFNVRQHFTVQHMRQESVPILVSDTQTKEQKQNVRSFDRHVGESHAVAL